MAAKAASPRPKSAQSAQRCTAIPLVRKAMENHDVTVATVCGGSLALAMGGLLEGRNAVTHHLGIAEGAGPQRDLSLIENSLRGPGCGLAGTEHHHVPAFTPTTVNLVKHLHDPEWLDIASVAEQ